jgi:Ca2+/H+ antiporter, TMEM165/GDT1 family
MMCCNENRGKSFWIKRAIFIPIAIAAGVFIFGSLVMFLWNSILPAVFGISTITFWQALGILVLSKILFGGFKGGHGHSHSGHHWRGKWMHLSPEEREKMKEEWRSRCNTPVKEE